MRNFPILFLSVIFLAACASPVAPSGPTATNIPATVTKLPTATPSPTDTPTTTPEPLVIVKPVEGEQKEALNKYFWEEIFFVLNQDSKYFQEFGIVTVEDFNKLVEENGGFLPASREGNNLNGFTDMNYQRGIKPSFGGVQMDKPLKADLGGNFVTLEELAENPIHNGLLYPNVGAIYKETDPNTSVQEGIIVNDKGDHREIDLTIVWRLEEYDLDGKKLNGSKDKLDEQANKYARELLFICRLMVHPDEVEEVVEADYVSVVRPGNVTGKMSKRIYPSDIRKHMMVEYDSPDVFQESP